MGATRFPGKPLAPILGLPMIEHVRRRVALCPFLDNIIVATCDEEIRRLVEDAGGMVFMTSATHERCTDRIAEAAQRLDADVVINVQGDEPLVMPEMLNAAINPFEQDSTLPAVNLVLPITDENEFHDPNAPKVVASPSGDLLYISREPIPSAAKAPNKDYRKLKQLGLIAFRADFLQIFARLPPTPLEMVESVDMNRAVEHGYKVKVIEVAGTMIGVDLPSDIARVERALIDDPILEQYFDR